MTLLIVYAAIAVAAGAVALWLPVRLPRAWWLLALAALPQLWAMMGVRHGGLALLSLGLCLGWGWLNRGLPGVGLLTLGLGLNLAVMAAHGGSMPISTAHLAALGSDVPAGTIIIGAKDVAVDGGALWWLGDWMTIQRSPYSLTASPGDLMVAAGLARWLLFSARTIRKPTNGSPGTGASRSLPVSDAAQR